MRQPNMTLAGLLAYDDTVLDELRLPDAMEDDREIVYDNLVLDTAGLEVVYTSPEFMKAAIGSWSRKMLPVWTELEATLHYDYDPISNYDRRENWEDSRTLNQESTNDLTHGESINTTSGLTHGETITTSGSMQHGETIDTTGRQNFGHIVTTNGTNDQTTANDTTGYNSNTYNALDRSIIDQDTTGSETHGGQDTSTGSETHSGTDSSSGSEAHSGTDSSTGSEVHSGTDANAGTLDVEESIERTGRAYGNIGVTTTQQMIEAQREVVLFNMIDTIVNDFKKRFCLMVY